MSDYASVCVLSYNRPDFLRECIGSLVAHAGAPFELIIHDDGSSDPACWKACMEFAGSLGATVILNKPGHNQGVGTAINRMFKMASGDPLIKVDQDLIFHPGWLEQLQGVLAQNRDESREEPPIGLMGLLHYHHDPVDSAKTMLADYGYFTSRTHIMGSSFALTREAWETFGPLSEHSDAFAEDWERMKEIEASGIMVNALPVRDLCFNRGMGPGPSTVVYMDDNNEVAVSKIHHGPYLHGVADASVPQ